MGNTERKQQQIDQYLQEPLKVGDDVVVRGLGLQDKNAWGGVAKVSKLLDNNAIEIEHNRYARKATEIVQDGDYYKFTDNIGHNPITTNKLPRLTQYSLDAIYFALFGDRTVYHVGENKDIPTRLANMNPFVYVDGERMYYQRDFVWTVEQCQNLIHSIYNRIDCGKVLVRKRSFEELERFAREGDREVYFYDVVDGKQRLTAIKKFIDNEYSDKNGFYYNDFSELAKKRFLGVQVISYGEMDENTSDGDVLEQFLLMNFAGVPQSTEHLDYVERLYGNLK